MEILNTGGEIEVVAETPYESKIRRLAEVVVGQEQVPCPVTHHFGGGQYVRETLFPAGTVVIGKYHRFDTVNILLQGTISLVNTDGTLKTIRAPQIIISKPGVKCGYAHDDVIWCNIHATEETDLEKIEQHFIDETKDITLEAKKTLEVIMNGGGLCLG